MNKIVKNNKKGNKYRVQKMFSKNPKIENRIDNEKIV